MPWFEKMMPAWAKRPLYRLARLYDQATRQSQALPDFIIIGAQKAGTTSLHYYLSQHPELLPAIGKEVHFFDGGLDPRLDNFEKGYAWYSAHFPPRKQMSAGQKTFEASPLYLFNPLAPRRIFDLIPKVKLVALLRNPTDRAISHYFHEKRLNRESLPIYEALQAEEKRLEPVLERKDYKNSTYIHHSYKSRGLYKEQLERYLMYFSWDQLLLLRSEELYTKPQNTLRRIFEFLDVDRGFKVKDLMPRNVAMAKHAVSPYILEYLDDYFFPHNESLDGLVGNRYDWEAFGRIGSSTRT